jgi:hypothetical protein
VQGKTAADLTRDASLKSMLKKACVDWAADSATSASGSTAKPPNKDLKPEKISNRPFSGTAYSRGKNDRLLCIH